MCTGTCAHTTYTHSCQPDSQGGNFGETLTELLPYLFTSWSMVMLLLSPSPFIEIVNMSAQYYGVRKTRCRWNDGKRFVKMVMFH